MQNGTFSLQDPIDEVGVFEQPTCQKLVCWLARESKSDSGAGFPSTHTPQYAGPRQLVSTGETNGRSPIVLSV